MLKEAVRVREEKRWSKKGPLGKGLGLSQSLLRRTGEAKGRVGSHP